MDPNTGEITGSVNGVLANTTYMTLRYCNSWHILAGLHMVPYPSKMQWFFQCSAIDSLLHMALLVLMGT